jgi:hypothetical protein
MPQTRSSIWSGRDSVRDGLSYGFTAEAANLTHSPG